MSELDFSALTPALFIVYVIFILLIGSSLSMAVMRAFQQKYRQMAILIVSAALFAALLYFVVQTWFIN